MELYVDVFHLGLWRPDIAPLYYFVDVHFLTFKDSLHPPVGQVAHPASDLVPLGHLFCVLPKIDALDPAAYKDMGTGLFTAAHGSDAIIDLKNVPAVKIAVELDQVAAFFTEEVLVRRPLSHEPELAVAVFHHYRRFCLAVEWHVEHDRIGAHVVE